MSGTATSGRYTEDWSHEHFPDINQSLNGNIQNIIKEDREI